MPGQASTNLEEIEKRVAALENSIPEIHRLLVAVQTKLIGSLDSDKPGLVNDIKQLQDKELDFEKELKSIREDLKRIQELTPPHYEQDSRDIWKQLEANKTFRMKLVGGIIVINFILGALALALFEYLFNKK